MFSYSKVQCHDTCPYQFKLKYIDKLEAVKDQSADNALYLGTAIHTGLETRSVEEAIKNYESNYSELTDDHKVAELRLRAILEKVMAQVPEGEYEYKLLADDGFLGFIDCLVPVEEGVYDLLDFKYSGNISGYSASAQIHIYKYYYEKLTGNKIRDIYYVFIPKCTASLNESKSNLEAVKAKIAEHANANDAKLVKIDYDPKLVGYFFGKKYHMERDTEYPKRYSTKCNWCDFSKYCASKGEDLSELDEKSILKLRGDVNE